MPTDRELLNDRQLLKELFPLLDPGNDVAGQLERIWGAVAPERPSESALFTGWRRVTATDSDPTVPDAGVAYEKVIKYLRENVGKWSVAAGVEMWVRLAISPLADTDRVLYTRDLIVVPAGLLVRPDAPAATSAPVPPDVVLFLRLVEIWHKIWDQAGRYGPAGLKLRRGLILFLGLIFVTYVLDAAVAHAYLSEQQVADLTMVEGAIAIGVATAKK